jgi:hypothetical protein
VPERRAAPIGGSRATLTVTVGHARPGFQHGLRLIAAVERDSLAGLVASLTGGKLRYAVAELQ